MHWCVYLINQLKMVLQAANQYERDIGQVLPITSDTAPVFGYLNIDNLIKDPGLSN